MINLLMMAVLADPMFDLVENTTIASLATVFYEDGTPFTSLVPYALDEEGMPIIFVSDLAIHTKNLAKNESCSLMVSQIDNKNLFNSSRLTYLGKMKKVPESEIDKAKKVYLNKYPSAEAFLELEDFSFYRMEVIKIYYIGGFGDIDWLDLPSYKQHWKK